jgi:hypothetical protein
LLESVCGKTDGKVPGKEAARDGLLATVEDRTGTATNETGTGRAAEDLGRWLQTPVRKLNNTIP